MITVKIKFWSAQLGFCLSDLCSAFESFVSASISCYGANQFMVKKKKKKDFLLSSTKGQDLNVL